MKAELTKQQVAAIQKDLHAALQPILKAHGLTLQKNSARYTSYDVRVSLMLALNSPDAEGEKARAQCGWMFKDYGIDYGTELTDAKGNKYTAVDFNRGGKLRARMTSDGKVYHAEPRFFRLDGKPLQSATDKLIAERNTANAAADAAKGAK